MNEKIIYTALVPNINIKDMTDYDGYVKLIHTKPCFYDQEYSIIEFEIIPTAEGDNEPEVIINTLGAVALHESLTNGFMILEEDLDYIFDIYSWEGAANLLIEDLLTTEDKWFIINKIAEEKKISLSDFYINDSTLIKESKKYTDIKDNIFSTVIIGIGTKDNPTEILWGKDLFEKYCNYSFYIQKDVEGPWESGIDDNELDYLMEYYDEESSGRFSNYAEYREAWKK